MRYCRGLGFAKFDEFFAHRFVGARDDGRGEQRRVLGATDRNSPLKTISTDDLKELHSLFLPPQEAPVTAAQEQLHEREYKHTIVAANAVFDR